MGFALQKLSALLNDLSLSIHDPLVIYSFLALYGLLTALLITYVHSRFRAAAKALKLLEGQWQNAESQHAAFVDIAKDKLSKLSSPVQAARPRAIGVDTRNQIVAMANRGLSADHIARTCGLDEGEVEVILGIARLQR